MVRQTKISSSLSLSLSLSRLLVSLLLLSADQVHGGVVLWTGHHDMSTRRKSLKGRWILPALSSSIFIAAFLASSLVTRQATCA